MTAIGREFLDWRRAVCVSGLPAGTRHVLLTLSLYAPAIGEAAFPALETLAEACGLSEDTVRTHLRRAEKKKWLRREARYTDSGRQTSNIYFMTLPAAMGKPLPYRNSIPSPLPKTATPIRGKERRGSASNEAHTCEEDLLGPKPERPDYTAAFEEVWAVHPRGGKRPAFDAYRKALKAKRITHGMLVERLGAYVATFHNGFRGAALHRWIRDEQWHERLDGGGENDQDRFVREELERQRELRAGGHD